MNSPTLYIHTDCIHIRQHPGIHASIKTSYLGGI